MIRLFTPLRIVTAGFLFWAVANHSHNYYVFLRWLVFLVALFGAYRAYHEVFDKWFLVCFQFALAIVFNPLLPFTFDKSTWTVIDIVASIVMLMSIFIVDSESTEYFSKTLPGKILGVGFIGGLTAAWIAGAFLVGLILIYMATDKSLQDLRLWLGGSHGKARIDQVRHDVEELEDAQGRVGYRDYYIVDYSFTSEGRTYYGTASLDENPIDLEGEAEATPQRPVFLDIEYQTKNPDNNRALGSASKLQHILPSLVFLSLGLGAVFWSLKSSGRVFLNLKAGKHYESE